MKLLALVMSAPVVFAATGCAPLVQATGDFSFTHPWQDYRRVVVRVRNGPVEVRSAPGDQISISGTKRVSGVTLAEAEQNLEQITIEAEPDPQHAETFRVEVRCPDELRNRSASVKLCVDLPHRCEAAVETTNGSIHVAGLTGEVVLESSNGSLRATDVQGALNAVTSNGRIEIRQIAGPVQARTSNGSIQVEGVGGQCTLRTSNGDIRLVADSTFRGPVELRTSNGSIHATLPTGLDAELRLSTSNGRVHVALGGATLKAAQASRTRFDAIMNAGGNLILAETSNGSIIVDGR